MLWLERKSVNPFTDPYLFEKVQLFHLLKSIFFFVGMPRGLEQKGFCLGVSSSST
jgi:hypothetical protein